MRCASGRERRTALRRALNDDLRLPSRESQAKPDAEPGKQRGYRAAVDFHGVLDHKEAVLRELQKGNQYSAAQAVEQGAPQSAAAQSTGGFGSQTHRRP